jgi:hypothetical protein
VHHSKIGCRLAVMGHSRRRTAETLRRKSMRSDALYPALSGEWEVPVTRNAKITPVNEGVGGRVGGPPLRDPPLAGVPRYP